MARSEKDKGQKQRGVIFPRGNRTTDQMQIPQSNKRNAPDSEPLIVHSDGYHNRQACIPNHKPYSGMYLQAQPHLRPQHAPQITASGPHLSPNQTFDGPLPPPPAYNLPTTFDPSKYTLSDYARRTDATPVPHHQRHIQRHMTPSTSLDRRTELLRVNQKLQSAFQEIQQRDTRISDLERTLFDRDHEIRYLGALLRDQGNYMSHLEQVLTERDEKISELEAEFSAAQGQITSLNLSKIEFGSLGIHNQTNAQHPQANQVYNKPSSSQPIPSPLPQACGTTPFSQSINPHPNLLGPPKSRSPITIVDDSKSIIFNNARRTDELEMKAEGVEVELPASVVAFAEPYINGSGESVGETLDGFGGIKDNTDNNERGGLVVTSGSPGPFSMPSRTNDNDGGGLDGAFNGTVNEKLGVKSLKPEVRSVEGDAGVEAKGRGKARKKNWRGKGNAKGKVRVNLPKA